MRRFVPGLLVLLAMACGSAVEPELGEEFTLHVGDYAVVTDVGLWITVAGVSDDSRCPRLVECVWAGDAAVRIETAPLPAGTDLNAQADTLHTNLEPKVLYLDSAVLTLVRLDPYPESPGSIPQRDYAATFVVERRGG